MKLYRTIVADPPWPYDSSGEHLRSTFEHRPNSFDSPNKIGCARKYGTMTIEEIAALRPPHEENAHLYLWTTNAFMVEAHRIAEAWGFEQKTILTWVKTKPDGEPSRKAGYYFRGATEHILFCVSGTLPLITSRAIPTVFFAPRLPHSVKPKEFYQIVEEASPEPRLDMFARLPRYGWDSWGDEIDGTIEGLPIKETNVAGTKATSLGKWL